MRIAVIGAGGMLGSRMTALLMDSGHQVLTPGRSQLDVTDSASLEKFFKNETFDGIVNGSAFTAVDACEDPAQYPLAFKVNALAVGEMAKLSREKKSWLVHVSTDYVFNGSGEKPWREYDSIQPLNAYGKTKAEGEKLFLEQGCPGWIVRTSWLYGPQGKHFVRTMAKLMREKTMVEVVEDQIGGPTYTVDLAYFLLDLIEGKPAMGLYHFANEDYVSWFGFADAIREKLGLSCEIKPIPSSRFPRPAKRPFNSRFDLSKSRAVARHPFRHWREALGDYLTTEPL